MSSDTVRFILSVQAKSDGDDIERDDLAHHLRGELLNLREIEAIEPKPSHPTGDVKAGMGVDWGTLFVTLAASGGVLTTLIGAVQAWLVRNERATVTLEIEGDKLQITGLSSDSQRKLVENWVHRHQH